VASSATTKILVSPKINADGELSELSAKCKSEGVVLDSPSPIGTKYAESIEQLSRGDSSGKAACMDIQQHRRQSWTPSAVGGSSGGGGSVVEHQQQQSSFTRLKNMVESVRENENVELVVVGGGVGGGGRPLKRSFSDVIVVVAPPVESITIDLVEEEEEMKDVVVELGYTTTLRRDKAQQQASQLLQTEVRLVYMNRVCSEYYLRCLYY